MVETCCCRVLAELQTDTSTSGIIITLPSVLVNKPLCKLRPRPHVSGDFCIRKFFYARFSKMAASRNVVCSMLLGLLSSLIACLELNVAMLNLNFNYLRRRLSIMRLLAISDSGIRRQTNELSLVFFCFSLN